MIKWKDDYSVGIMELDKQHKNLFVFSNDLDGILQDRDVTKKKLEYALDFLGSYVSNHFSREETCMHQYACPVSGKNKLAHEKFIEAYKTYETKFNQDNDGYGILYELHTFLENWLVEHICKIDAQLKQCIH